MFNLKIDQQTLQELITEVKALREESRALQERVRDLEEKLNTNSKNSSKSPSQDPYRSRGGKGKSSGKKQGAQKGHRGTSRSKVPFERVSEFRDIHPEICPSCGGSDFANIPISTEVRQVTELPEIQAEVTQFNVHTCSCASCGEWVKAEVPPEASSAFGPRLKGFISSLTGDLGVTKRKVVNLVGYLNIKISVGSVCGIHHLAGKILERPCEDIREKVLSQESLHSDETSWYHKGKRQWLWVITGEEGAYFKIHPSRSSAAFQSVLGGASKNQPLTTDRYSAYNSYEGPRQFCWSHLKRDFEKIADRGDIDGVIGQRLKEETHEVFAYWQSFEEGIITRDELQAHMEAIVLPPLEALLILGSQGQGCASRTRGTCKQILSQFDSLWTYLYHEGVTPTNNLAERDIRPSVIQRKLSYGTQSDAGKSFTERALTVAVTFKKHSKNIFDYLTSCFEAHSRDAPIPSPI